MAKARITYHRGNLASTIDAAHKAARLVGKPRFVQATANGYTIAAAVLIPWQPYYVCDGVTAACHTR